MGMIENPQPMTYEEALTIYNDLPDKEEHEETKKTLEYLLNIKKPDSL